MPETSDDVRLVVAARAGERAAFGRLYERYARMVHGILLARVPPGEAADLVQDIFLMAMRRLDTLRNPAAFGGWLAQMARNLAVDFYRRRRPVDALAENSARYEQGSHAEAAAVLEAIRALPDAYREPLMLRLVEGMTGPEIAERTGMTHGSVRVNLSRGMKLLREKLGGASGHE